MFEERVTREFRKGDMPGFAHTYIGAEAVAAGICMHLSDKDYISSTHRGHGHCIAKGCSFRGMLAELYGKKTGLCKGRGGSMHIADFERIGSSLFLPPVTNHWKNMRLVIIWTICEIPLFQNHSFS